MIVAPAGGAGPTHPTPTRPTTPPPPSAPPRPTPTKGHLPIGIKNHPGCHPGEEPTPGSAVAARPADPEPRFAISAATRESAGGPPAPGAGAKPVMPRPPSLNFSCRCLHCRSLRLALNESLNRRAS